MEMVSVPRDIRIDKDGIWYYRGVEMIRKDIVHLFYRHIKRDQSGRYLIDYEGEKEYLDVDDTPYIIKSVTYQFSEGRGDDAVILQMPDESSEVLDPATLRIGNDNALYGILKEKDIEARFSRASYYQLAEHIEQDPECNKYYVSLNAQRYYIADSSSRNCQSD